MSRRNGPILPFRLKKQPPNKDDLQELIDFIRTCIENASEMQSANPEVGSLLIPKSEFALAYYDLLDIFRGDADRLSFYPSIVVENLKVTGHDHLIALLDSIRGEKQILEEGPFQDKEEKEDNDLEDLLYVCNDVLLKMSPLHGRQTPDTQEKLSRLLAELGLAIAEILQLLREEREDVLLSFYPTALYACFEASREDERHDFPKALETLSRIQGKTPLFPEPPTPRKFTLKR